MYMKCGLCRDPAVLEASVSAHMGMQGISLLMRTVFIPEGIRIIVGELVPIARRLAVAAQVLAPTLVIDGQFHVIIIQVREPDLFLLIAGKSSGGPIDIRVLRKGLM